MIFIISSTNRMNQELFYEIASNHQYAIIRHDGVKERLSELECDPASLTLIDIDDKNANPKEIISDIHHVFQGIPIIGTTNDISKAKDLKKTLNDYNVTHIVFEPTIKSIERSIESFIVKAINANSKTIFLDDNLKNQIRRDLIGLGCKASSKGIQLIADSILFLIKRGKSKFSITKDIYFYLAKKYNMSTAAIERSIRCSIKQIKDSKHNSDLIEKIFPYTDIDHLTNLELVCTLTEYYKGENK